MTIEERIERIEQVLSAAQAGMPSGKPLAKVSVALGHLTMLRATLREQGKL